MALVVVEYETALYEDAAISRLVQAGLSENLIKVIQSMRDIRYSTVRNRRYVMATTARLDLRMDTQDKDKIAHAANLRGVPVATFVRLAALREAETVTAETNTVVLSSAETKRLLAAFDKSFKPSARLQRALDQTRNVTFNYRTTTLAHRLRGRATAHLSTDEIMQLTRGA